MGPTIVPNRIIDVEGVRKPFDKPLDGSWSGFEGSRGALGVLLGPLGVLWGYLAALLGLSWVPSEVSQGLLESLGVLVGCSWGSLGMVLAPPWMFPQFSDWCSGGSASGKSL